MNQFKIKKEINSETLEQFATLCGGVPDAIYLLARGVVESREHRGEYQSGGYEDLDAQGLLSGGKAVSSAGAQLHILFPETLIIANTKLPIDKEPRSNAQIYKEELISQGVKPDVILLQENSYSTFTEIGEMIKLIVARNLKHVVLITNEFQIKRAQAFLDKFETLKDPNGYWQDRVLQASVKEFRSLSPSPRITFVSAEDILSLNSKHNSELIGAVKKSPEWLRRVTSEDQGTSDILNGTYWTKNISKNFIQP